MTLNKSSLGTGYIYLNNSIKSIRKMYRCFYRVMESKRAKRRSSNSLSSDGGGLQHASLVLSSFIGKSLLRFTSFYRETQEHIQTYKYQ